MGTYIPSTKEEQLDMLKAIGYDSVDQLYVQVPKEMLIHGLDLPKGKSELEVRRTMTELARKNTVYSSVFRGAGAYKHYIPSVVKSVVSKETFLTAYTPYQAEISQGILQAIFEYQTMICTLTGMDVSNASIYDGASAAAEAVAMCRDRKRSTVLVSETTHPMVIEAIETYCFGSGAEVRKVPMANGVTDQVALKEMLTEDVACVYVQQPNYFGSIEPTVQLGEVAHEGGAKYIMGVNPISLAVLKSPRECGADIAVGEGQPLGMSLSFGGPYLGFMACTDAMKRQLPGRVVGQTTDHDGNRAFVLTLQAREQHIRREKASSNVCSNQALCALTACVYLASMGETGLLQVAEQSMAHAHYLSEQICSISGFEMVHKSDFFHEFVTTCPCDVTKLMKALANKGILGGMPIDGGILWCATEMNTKADMDALVAVIKEVC